MKPILIDGFCKAGGATRGYQLAGFHVIGIDRESQPRYVGDELVVGDFFEVLAELLVTRPVTAIHASPPCQAYSDLAGRNGNADDWPRLVEPLQDLLGATGLPYVIENVEGAPLRSPLTLCGTMFPGLRVLRHRLFESNVGLSAPTRHPAHPLVFTYDRRKSHYGRLDQNTSFVQVTGGGNCSVANARAAMGIDWMTKDELNQAIPPAYTRHIGAQLLQHVSAGVGS